MSNCQKVSFWRILCSNLMISEELLNATKCSFGVKYFTIMLNIIINMNECFKDINLLNYFWMCSWLYISKKLYLLYRENIINQFIHSWLLKTNLWYKFIWQEVKSCHNTFETTIKQINNILQGQCVSAVWRQFNLPLKGLVLSILFAVFLIVLFNTPTLLP